MAVSTTTAATPMPIASSSIALRSRERRTESADKRMRSRRIIGKAVCSLYAARPARAAHSFLTSCSLRVLDHAPVAHANVPAGALRDFGIMGDDQQRDATGIELLQRFQHFRARGVVQV